MGITYHFATLAILVSGHADLEQRTTSRGAQVTFLKRQRPPIARVVAAGAAALLAVGIAACTSSTSSGGGTGSGATSGVAMQGQLGSVPNAATGTETAGTITVAGPPNSAPTWILPIVPGSSYTVFNDYEFDYQMYRPLYWLVNGVEPTENPAMSLADDPTWSNGDKTVSFTLKSSYKWSDGQPITAQDVLFWFYLLKAALKESPANWAPYTPALGLPDEVSSISAPSPSTVTMTLTKSVNPTWFWQDELGSLQPMPSHAWDIDTTGGKAVTDWATNPADAKKIYDYLAAASKSVSTYASNPLWQVINGPYKLTAFSASNGGFTMAPNAAYGGPHASVESKYQIVPFTSDQAEYNAVVAGSVDVGYVPLSNVPKASSLTSSWNEFGYPGFGFSYVSYNFKDTTGDFNNIIDKLYVRQALAHLEDEAGYIKAFFNGAGGQAYGPVPSLPKSPYTPANATTNPYPFSTADAASILKANGWTVVPNGTDTCAKPGTGAGECGAGIPAGTKLEWNVFYGTDPTILGEQVQDWASQAKTVGITMNLGSSNFDYQIANYNDPSSPKTINKWAMDDFGGFSISTYPTTFGVFNTGASENIGEYQDATATQLITASITSPNASAVTSEAEYLTTQQPGLFQPNTDGGFGTASIVVWQKKVSGDPKSWESLTQDQWNPEYWFFTK
jgi:peptide/nickel transport system substrate-binding protein